MNSNYTKALETAAYNFVSCVLCVTVDRYLNRLLYPVETGVPHL